MHFFFLPYTNLYSIFVIFCCETRQDVAGLPDNSYVLISFESPCPLATPTETRTSPWKRTCWRRRRLLGVARAAVAWVWTSTDSRGGWWCGRGGELAVPPFPPAAWGHLLNPCASQRGSAPVCGGLVRQGCSLVCRLPIQLQLILNSCSLRIFFERATVRFFDSYFPCISHV